MGTNAPEEKTGGKKIINPIFLTPEKISHQLSKYLREKNPTVERVQKFIDQGADLYTKEGDYQRTPLMAALRKGLNKIATLLLQHMDFVDDTDYQNNTALMWASDVEMAKQLLDKGANIHTRAIDGTTVIMDAVSHGNPELLEFFLKKIPEDIDEQTATGATALIKAAEQKEEACLLLLLKYGANPTLLDKRGDTALDALKENYPVEDAKAPLKQTLYKAQIDFNANAIMKQIVQPVQISAERPHLTRKPNKNAP